MDNNVVIVTRHQPVVDWLRKQGVTGKVIKRASVEEIAGKDVYGNLPLYLALRASTVTIITFPHLLQGERVDRFSVEEMDDACATMLCLSVSVLNKE